MKRSVAIFLVILVFGLQEAYSQKVKYKDLFILLNSKKYEEAEPFLRIFLSDPKNADQANAHLQMALMFEFKANRNDLLTQNNLLVNNIDSALYFFAIAKNMIDDKEISKNDEFYQSYSRRDLRTGKFGIKLSDIHFDIENKVKALQDQRVSITKLYENYVKTGLAYAAADSVFGLIQNKFTNQNNLYLKAKDPDLENLKLLTIKFDSTRFHFNLYKTYLEKFPESNYAQKISLIEVGKLEEVALMPTNWKEEDIKVRNYREWATKTESLINTELKSIRDHLVTYNTQLDNLTKKTLEDSISTRNELTSLVDQMLSEDLTKYETNPIPLAVLNYKVSRLKYLDKIFQNEYQELAIEDRISEAKLRAEMGEEALNQVEIIGKYDLGEELEKYPNFLNALGGKSGISALIVDGTREMNEAVTKWQLAEKHLLERMNWGISKADSVSLNPGIVQGKKYVSLHVTDSIPEIKAIVAGIVNSEARQSFTAIIDQKYEIETLYTFEMDPFIDSLKLDVTPLAQVIDKANILSGFYAMKSDTLARMDLSLIKDSSILWTTHIDVPGKVSRVHYMADNDEVNIYFRRNENEEQVLTLDAAGKPKDQ